MAAVSFNVKEKEGKVIIEFELKSIDEARKLSRIFAAQKNISAPFAKDRLNYQSSQKESTITVSGDFNGIYSVLSSIANGIYPSPEEQLITQEQVSEIKQLWDCSTNPSPHTSKSAFFTSQHNDTSQSTPPVVIVGGPGNTTNP